MLPLVEPGSEDARTIRGNIDEARSLSGEKKSAASKGVQGVVTLAAVAVPVALMWLATAWLLGKRQEALAAKK